MHEGRADEGARDGRGDDRRRDEQGKAFRLGRLTGQLREREVLVDGAHDRERQGDRRSGRDADAKGKSRGVSEERYADRAAADAQQSSKQPHGTADRPEQEGAGIPGRFGLIRGSSGRGWPSGEISDLRCRQDQQQDAEETGEHGTAEGVSRRHSD